MHGCCLIALLIVNPLLFFFQKNSIPTLTSMPWSFSCGSYTSDTAPMWRQCNISSRQVIGVVAKKSTGWHHKLSQWFHSKAEALLEECNTGLLAPPKSLIQITSLPVPKDHNWFWRWPHSHYRHIAMLISISQCRSGRDFGQVHLQRLCFCQSVHQRRIYFKWRYCGPIACSALHWFSDFPQ